MDKKYDMAKEIKGKHQSTQNMKVAVDNCIFTVKDGTLHLLLIQMKKKPYTGMWALPGGLIRERESLDDAAARVLEEETGVRGVYLEQLYTFGQVSRDPFGRVVSVAYVALIPWARHSLRTISKYADVRWWPVHPVRGSPPSRSPSGAPRAGETSNGVKDIPKKLAYDHTDIADYAGQRLAWKLEYTNVAWSLLPSKFTLTELQDVYEAVLGHGLDKRNFRKKILSLKLVEEVGETAMRGAHRPAMLYRFKSTKPQFVDIL